MFNWLKNLFLEKCPKCGSTNVVELPVFTMTYNIHYGCVDCDHRWKKNGL